MKFNSPTLSLSFLSDDIKEGHLREQTIGKDGIVSRSISIDYQLLSNLESSSNQAHILILGRLPVIEDIISTEGNIKAVLKDGDDVVFTGFLSTSFTWNVTDSGEKALSLTIEDIGTRELEKPFIEEGVHLFNTTARSVVERIAKKVGITLSSTFPPFIDEVTYLVEAGESAKDILTSLFYELGYAYYFTPNGELDAYKIECKSTDNVPVIGEGKLYSVGGTAITLKKTLRQYSGARIIYTALGEAEDYLIYRNETGKGTGHPYCYLPLDAGESFDGSSVYKVTEGEEIILPRLEAVNASGESDIVGSNKIVSISNLRPYFVAESGYISASIKEAGGPYINISAKNTGHLKYHITRLDAYADIIYEKSTNIVRADNSLAVGSKSLLSEELKWVHTKEKATEHANLLSQYYKNAGSEYSFYSTDEFEVGDIVRLADTIHSSLVVSVLIYSKTVTDESNVAVYRSVAIEPFNLMEKVFIETLLKSNQRVKGEDGKDGESYTVIIHSDNGMIFRQNNIKVTLSCQVLRNNEDVTSSLEDWRFTWKRTTESVTEDERWNTSSKAIGHKEVVITDKDCIGRTVFTCSVEL